MIHNNTYMSVTTSGSIEVYDYTFNDVVCVSLLSTNLISIYHITHCGKGKTFEFTPDSMHIQDQHSREIIEIGRAVNASWLYEFSHFSPINHATLLIGPSYNAFWVDQTSNGRFGHLNLYFHLIFFVMSIF